VDSALISIIVPCYNASSYLKEAIESVLKQTHQQFELILVNDGSTDDSETIIKSYRDERIRYYYQENKGQCAASNFGLAKASGDYIKFFDADDVMNETHLEAQLKKLNGRTDAVASCAWGRFYDGNPLSATFKAEPVWKDMLPLDWIKAALSQSSDMMGAWLWLIPKQVIQQSGGWDERLSLNNDFEFSIRLLLHAQKVLFAEDAKLFYRSGINGLSDSNSEKAWMAGYLATQLGCDQLLKADNSNEMKQLCANRYQQWIFRIYPLYPHLVSLFQNKVDELGGSNNQMEGGFFFLFLSKIFGWKFAKKSKHLLKEKFGYRKLPFN
jgi:glycosyltransferase involved in cell wall biosynthesis